MGQRTCSVDGCDRPFLARGWCGTHYARWRKTAPPSAIRRSKPRPRRDPAERFREKYRVLDNGCWEWTAASVPDGYGTFWDNGKYWIASRWSWAATNGPIPRGQFIDHFRFPDACIGPACVNPDHLRPVTPRESVLRSEAASALNAAKDACPRGHVYDSGNTRRARGQRACRTCDRDAARTARDLRAPNRLPAPAARTHCLAGHPFDEANTRFSKDGRRACRACDRNRARASHRLKRATAT